MVTPIMKWRGIMGAMGERVDLRRPGGYGRARVRAVADLWSPRVASPSEGKRLRGSSRETSDQDTRYGEREAADHAAPAQARDVIWMETAGTCRSGRAYAGYAIKNDRGAGSLGCALWVRWGIALQRQIGEIARRVLYGG